MPKVTVIVLVYKVEKFIERCVRSLFEQTLDDIEYVFINDCTPDNSIGVLNNVLDDFPQRVNQVRIIDFPNNVGQAAARTSGLKEARGEYVIFCDSDDWVDVDMYRQMYELASQEKADCVICDYYITDDENNRQIKREGFTGELFDDLMSHRISYSLCNKMYNTELFDPDVFYVPRGNVGEDTIINLNLAYKSHIVKHISSPLYFYFENYNSISRAVDITSVMRRFSESQKNVEVLKKFARDKNIEKKYENEIITLLAIKREWLGPYLRNRDVYNIWKKTNPEINKRLLFSHKISVKRKIKFLLHLLRIPTK